MSMKFVQRGIKRVIKEEWEEAEDEFVKAVELNDISAKGWYYLGFCREHQEDTKGAIYSYKKAIHAAKMQEPDDLETMRQSLFHTAQIEIVNKQYIAAMGYLRKINQMEFKDNEMKGKSWGLLGEIYERLNKLAEALHCYKQASRYGNKKYRKNISNIESKGWRPDDPEDKTSPNLLKRKADILFNQQKFQEAIKGYEDTIKVNSYNRVLRDIDHADTVMKIAYSYINLQDFNKARNYLIEARKLYKRTSMAEELRIIDSTLNKINSLTAV